MKTLIKNVLKKEQRLIEEYNAAVLVSDEPLTLSRTMPTYLRHRIRLMRFLVGRVGMWMGDGLVATMCLALRDGDTFIDAGANIGEFTWRASSLVGPSGAVHSFEPCHSTACVLRKRVAALRMNNVNIVEAALGDKSGSAVLHVFAEHWGASNSLAEGAWPGHEEAEEIEVPVFALDEYIEKNNVGPVRMIKIDVQGGERNLLSGAKKLLTAADPPVLYTELEAFACDAFGYTINDLLATIHGFGYNTYSWRDNGMVMIESEKDIPAEVGHDDVICLHASAHEALLGRLQSLASKRS